MNLDKDLQAIQDVRTLVAKAREAQSTLKALSQEEIDKIVAAMAGAGFQEAERLAKLAVQETGYGNVPDKIMKNQLCTRDLYESIKELRTVGVIREDRKNKLLEIAEPFGVVAAIVPTTNPTSTAMFKSIISVKAGNGVVISPHPRAVNCTLAAANVMAEAALSAGAPEGIIGAISISTLKATKELMHHPDVHLILATGGTGLVRAAYSAGKPAYGVGPGNVPSYIDRSADYQKAVADIVAGKTFDYGTLCSSEQAVIVDAPLKSRFIQALKDEGAHFLEPDEKCKLGRALVTPDFRINAELVGKSPQVLAEKAGFQTAADTRLLVAELDGVGKDYPLSAEKLSPVLTFYIVNGWEEGIRRCVEILNFGGRGHTASVHAKDDNVIRQFGLAVPASRVVVNSPSSLGAVGYTNQLMPSMTLGCGSYGGNITSDNITAHHLINIKRVAYETHPLSAPRNGTSWRPGIHHHWRDSDAPYTKALSADVSRKRTHKQQPGPSSNGHEEESAQPEKRVYGATGMTAAEVEDVVEQFLKNKN